MNIVHFHLIVLHFPIALLIVGALLEVWAAITGRSGVRSTARVVVVLGGLAAIATAFSGQAAEEIVEEAVAVSHDVLEAHEEGGMLATYFAAALVLLELLTLRLRSTAVHWATAGLAVVTAVLVALAGLSGGKIRHDQPFERGVIGSPPAGSTEAGSVAG